MRSIAIIAFLALLITPSVAEPDSVVIGPYNISFDLGLPKSEYAINTDQIVEQPQNTMGRTQYNLFIENVSDTNKSVTFLLSDYEVPSSASFSPENSIEQLQKGQPLSATVKETRTIDGKGGVIGESEPGMEPFYLVIYFPTPYLNVEIVSTYPWDEGTLSLLKTIQIEKVNTTTG